MARNIDAFTTNQIPMPHIIEKFWRIVQYTATVEISNQGIIPKRYEEQESIDNFLNSIFIPEEANAVIGVKISTSAQDFTNRKFLYITYIGTPVKYTLI
jgi:hypothetical protein